MRVIVFGASGVQGRHQVRMLARGGHSVVAVSRKPQPVLVDNIPVETFAANFTDTATIARVLQDADRIFLNLPSTSFNQSEPIIAAAKAIGKSAKKANVPLILFNTSMPVPKEKQDIKAQDDRREMRRLLRESGVPVISIEPVVYLDNLLEGWALSPIRDRSTVVYCHKPDLQVSWICHHDVAQIMMAAMHRPDLAGRDIPVGGPETLRLEQLAEKLSRAWGRKLDYENQTVADFCEKIGKTMQGRGLETDKIVSQMFKAYTYYNEAPDEPFNVDMGPVAEELGVKLTPIEEWAKRRSPWDDKGYF
ncbi:NAD(P)-binding protein [Cucurbitaria berberidis CBS 394.84]|uniref:NAD(P)-binding protein n=1 Tax=Cucurbitaria berberidis CBS 394.84 TaxID=1168544 RepID=A0A9P4GPW2_9PLEO|nr:NAD(P)-binding protein [Cucurbitaria berberidis CBS 394.84]KAF1850503.1 NAD(P)-binding protein [Cucurbitaria berberidis CBS 394.84]